jgi:hypothetical protein
LASQLGVLCHFILNAGFVVREVKGLREALETKVVLLDGAVEEAD